MSRVLPSLFVHRKRLAAPGITIEPSVDVELPYADLIRPVKALSALNETSGGALVPPPKQTVKQKRTIPQSILFRKRIGVKSTETDEIAEVLAGLFSRETLAAMLKENKSLLWYRIKSGFSGVKKDKLGRRICYENGKRVACPEVKKPVKEKPTKYDAEQASSKIADILKAGKGPEQAKQVLDLLSGMTTAEINKFKKKHGLRASGAKLELAKKVAERLVAKKPPEPAVEKPAPEVPKVEPPKQPDKSSPDYWGGKGSKQPFYRPGPNPTVDMIPTRKNGQEVLLIRRKPGGVEGGKWALAGGFVDSSSKRGEEFKWDRETPEQAAIRELAEESGLDVSELQDKLKHVGHFDKRGRDPRDNDEAWSESDAFRIDLTDEQANQLVQGRDDADRAEWVPVSELANRDIAFDHRDILEKAGIGPDKPPEPGFTGTDSLGRRWVDGELVAKEEDLSSTVLDRSKPASEAVRAVLADPEAGRKLKPYVDQRIDEMMFNELEDIGNELGVEPDAETVKRAVAERLKGSVPSLKDFKLADFPQRDPENPVAKSLRDDPEVAKVFSAVLDDDTSRQSIEYQANQRVCDKLWKEVNLASNTYGAGSPEYEAVKKRWYESVQKVRDYRDKYDELKATSRAKLIEALSPKNPPPLKVTLHDGGNFLSPAIQGALIGQGIGGAVNLGAGNVVGAAVGALAGAVRHAIMNKPFVPTDEQRTAIDGGVNFVRSTCQWVEGGEKVTFADSRSGGAAFVTSGDSLLGPMGVDPKVLIGTGILAKTGTVIHELGHMIEELKPGVKQKMLDFFKYRTEGGIPQRISVNESVFNLWQGVTGIKDNFDRYYHFDHEDAVYAGHFYKGLVPGLSTPATELLSTGLEALYSDPVGFMSADPEWAAVVIQCLRM